MAKKTITTTEEVDAEDETAAPEREDDEVVRALTELEGATDVRWQIHRLGGTNPGYCGELTTAQLTLENLSRKYGAGQYKVKGVKHDGKYFKSATITVAEIMNTDNNIADVIKALQDKPASNDASLMPLMLAMMNNSTSIVTAALSRPQAEKKEIPWTAILAATPLLLTSVKEFFKNNNESDAMDKLIKQLSLLDKLKGTDEKGSSWPDVLRDALSSVPAILSSRGPTQPTQVIARTMPPVETIAETPDAVEPTVESMSMDWFKKKIEELLQNAAQNKDPELRAEVFLDDLPVFIPESVVKAMLEREDWFEQLTQFDARVLSYHGWFTELRDNILNTFNPDGGDEKNDE